MPRLVVVSREGKESQVDAAVGLSVMEALRDNGVDEVLALCGGVCSCGTCHVYVDTGSVSHLPEIGQDESDLLEISSHRRENSRLGCQLRLSDELDGLRVTVAPED